jgi:hypothetical protein
MELLNKITMKAIEVQPKAGTLKEGEKLALARVFGRASNCKAKTSDYGESFCFNGNFEAIRISDGAVFKSAKVFLPKTIEGLLAEALTSSEGAVDFAVEIGVKHAANAFGYEWTVKPLVENTGQADELAHLRGPATAALPAPAVDTATSSRDTSSKPTAKKGTAAK